MRGISAKENAMDGLSLTGSVANFGGGDPHKVEETSKMVSQADQMKAIRKAKLNRQVLADPSMAGKLVAMSSSPVYNAKGDLIQTVGASQDLSA